MKFPIFASIILFTLWLGFAVQRSKNVTDKSLDEFWKREALANHVRKKPLDDLKYITYDPNSLPLTLLEKDETAVDLQNLIHHLATEKIVNLSGYSNTDIKLQYGTANLRTLSAYDQNYTLLARNLNRLAERYYNAGYIQEAKTLLEFAVSTETDVSGTYKMLAGIYLDEKNPEKIDQLIKSASQIRGIMCKPIVRMLQELYPYSD